MSAQEIDETKEIIESEDTQPLKVFEKLKKSTDISIKKYIYNFMYRNNSVSIINLTTKRVDEYLLFNVQ